MRRFLMVMDALRGYVQLANGLTEVTKQRAQQAAKALLQQTGADALTAGVTTKVSDLAEEIVATSKSNRQLLQAIVANEVEGAVARLGFVRSEEVAALTRRVDGLERELAEANDALVAATAAASAPAPASSASTSASTSAAAGAGPAAKKAAVKTPPVKKTAGSAKTAAKTAAVKQAAVKKAAAKKTSAAKTAKKAPAKKA
ncbi:phasin family protein [Kribbella sp. NPDC051620]|uniref:phasin family protein n=1 Tax=Kribbella sp. NPDC051620 TaxID=3364120 RepID=UPI0037B08D4F